MPRSPRRASSSTTSSTRWPPTSATTTTPSRGSCWSAGPPPQPTGADKTSIIAELPADRSGALLELLEQFSTRGVNLSLLQSRPIGDALGRYRFIIDADGHILDERVADAMLGVRRFSPRVIFLGSYPRADQAQIEYVDRYGDEVFIEARDWLRSLVSGEPEVSAE
jgi:prephenate dehydratase